MVMIFVVSASVLEILRLDEGDVHAEEDGKADRHNKLVIEGQPNINIVDGVPDDPEDALGHDSLEDVYSPEAIAALLLTQLTTVYGTIDVRGSYECRHDHSNNIHGNNGPPERFWVIAHEYDTQRDYNSAQACDNAVFLFLEIVAPHSIVELIKKFNYKDIS